jgi:hypothetical protein
MRFHPLAPEVKCPRCGGDLVFVRVRVFGDLYRCKCMRQVMHYRNTDTKTCGYAALYRTGVFGKWTACDMPAAARE